MWAGAPGPDTLMLPGPGAIWNEILGQDRQSKALRAAVISNQEVAAREGGAVPGLSVESREASELDVSVRPGLDQGDVSVFGLDQEQVIDQQDLPVAVSTSFPEALAGRRLLADEDAVAQSIDLSVARDDVGELRAERVVLPELLDGEVTRLAGLKADELAAHPLTDDG